jgi:anti-anti-sigma factor
MPYPEDTRTVSPPFRCTTSHRGTTHVVAVVGEIDIVTAPVMADEVHWAIEEGPETVVLDLSEVGFLDSAALNTTRQLAMHAQARDVRLVILPAPAPVHEPFVIAGLEHDLPFALRVER